MNDMTVATVRTAVPAGWGAFVLWLIGQLGFNLTEQATIYVIVGTTFVVGVLYRVFREVEARWPWFGRIFLLSSRAPIYPVPVDNEYLEVAAPPATSEYDDDEYDIQ